MNVENWMWAQWVMIVLYAINIVANEVTAKRGFLAVIGASFGFTVLYFGGFWE